MFLKDKKIGYYGFSLGKEGGNWFYFRFQWKKPFFIYFYLKFLPLPIVRFHHFTGGQWTGTDNLWAYYGKYYLEGLAIRVWSMSEKPRLPKLRIEFDEICFLPVSGRVKKIINQTVTNYQNQPVDIYKNENFKPKNEVGEKISGGKGKQVLPKRTNSTPKPKRKRLRSL